MKITKRIILLVLIVLLAFSVCACVETKEEKSDKISVITTLFVQYDFVREIAGDKADITLLMPPGTDSHSFEPKSTDMIKINECDVFVYTGENMEVWAEKVITSLKDANTVVCDTSRNIDLLKEDHEDSHTHDNDVDPHIWTSPKNALIMVENICEALCEADEKNALYYIKRKEIYTEKLEKLDSEIREVLSGKTNKKMIFAGKFPFFYFAKEYGISYENAIKSCSGESEPDIKLMTALRDMIEKENIKAVFYPELSDTRIAKTLCEDTDAKMMLFHSCHNVTKEEFENKESYISLMEKNIAALEEGLY